MPRDDPTLSRDLSLAVLLAAVSSLPLIASGSGGSPGVRSQLRDLVRVLSRAVALSLATTAAVVLGGGALLVAERAYHRLVAACRSWSTGAWRRPRSPPPPPPPSRASE